MSSRILRLVLVLLTGLGVALASYLTYVHYSGAVPLCTATGNPCLTVQRSVYSELVGVPVALIGLIGYIAILVSLIIHENDATRGATTCMAITGLTFSGYLTYRELFTLHIVCEECATSAVLMVIITCLSGWRYVRGGYG